MDVDKALSAQLMSEMVVELETALSHIERYSALNTRLKACYGVEILPRLTRDLQEILARSRYWLDIQRKRRGE